MGEEGTLSSRSQRNACETGPREQTGPALSVKWVPDVGRECSEGEGTWLSCHQGGNRLSGGPGSLLPGQTSLPFKITPSQSSKAKAVRSPTSSRWLSLGSSSVPFKLSLADFSPPPLGTLQGPLDQDAAVLG